MPTSTHTLISSNVVTGSSVGSITISSIPGTYRDLIAVVNAKSTSSGGSLQVRFNGDSGANYNDVITEAGPNAGLSTTFGTGRTQLISTWVEQEVGASNSVTIYEIMDYSSTTLHKNVIVRVNKDGSVVGMAMNRYASTSAITSILFSANMAIDSRIDLYGIVS
jgi:hypothetical protein